MTRTGSLALATALLIGGAQGALAQRVLIPPSPSEFGVPTIATPAQPRIDPYRPTLPSPTDMPDANGTKAGANADVAFGAYQRGFYNTAMREAMRRSAANPKDGPALTLIGELYAQGLSVNADKAEAARWFKLGADAGDPQAMFELGMAAMKGEGVPQSKDQAKAMFLRAGAQDNAGALFYLGIMALQNNGVVPDYTTAAAYFEHAAALGNSEAQYALAIMFRNGTGRPQSDTEAAAMMRKAADNDNIAAQVEYGIMLFNGVGVDKDETGAARYFIKGAGHNNPVAQDRAARLYVSGRGVKKDVIEGMKWHLLARSAGLEDPWLDGEMTKLTPDERQKVETAVRRYIGS